MDLNTVSLIGHVGMDPEARSTPSGRVACTMRLDTVPQDHVARGDTQAHATWHSLIAWDHLAEFAITQCRFFCWMAL